MSLNLQFNEPDFSKPPLSQAPAAELAKVIQDGILPKNYHASSNLPEYIKLKSGKWILAPEGRMDAVFIVKGESIEVIEPRRVRKGDMVVIGRTENGEQGIFVHDQCFSKKEESGDKFSFRSRGTRETPFSHSYDSLYSILRNDREHGHIVWVLGPAVAFDKDSRDAMQGLIENGFCHALMAGNALATHDIEAAYFGTGLGQDIYSQKLQPLGHYNHLDIINKVRKAGSIKEGIEELGIDNGIMYACEKKEVPYVLAGSIRDDGPLPSVIPSAYDAQHAMRVHARQATTVLCMATQLHSIAFGNMTPSYRIESDGSIRPVYFYIVDMSEFSADKLANRGSGQAEAILTNVQDFIVNLWNNLKTEK